MLWITQPSCHQFLTAILTIGTQERGVLVRILEEAQQTVSQNRTRRLSAHVQLTYVDGFCLCRCRQHGVTSIFRITPHQGGDDMHGNVCERVADFYRRDYYASSPEEDPPGPEGKFNRSNKGRTILRGGAC